MSLDFAVLGAGHEALVAACYLAKSGRSVTIFGSPSSSALACRPVGAASDALWTVAPEDLGLLDSRVLDELELARFGLATQSWPSFALAGTEAVALSGPQAPPELRGVVEAATALRRRIDSLLLTPGDVSSLSTLVVDPELLADVSLSVEERLARGLPEAAAEALRVLGTWGQQLSPVDQGTGLLLALQVAGGEGGIRPHESASTPDAGFVASLERCARALGVDFRPSADALWLEGGKVVGVECEGEGARAETVLSSFDARHTYLDWVGARHLPVDLVRSLESTRYRGGLARCALLLDGELAPPVPGGVRWIVSDPGTADRVCDEARLGRESHSPWLDVLWASTAIPGSAPPQTTLLTISAQSFPYALRERRSDVQALLMKRLRHILPLDEHPVLASELVLPEDLERRFGLTEGHLHGAEMGLDQLFSLRGRGADLSPSHDWLPGLELCSGSVHPGGLTLGLVGRQCAQRHLEEAR